MTLSFPVPPMKATLGTMPASDDGWAYEIKWDGYRTLAFVEGERVRLQSSNLIDVTHKYPEFGGLPGAVAAGRAILDAELVVLDDLGRPRFELIQRHERQAALFVFDVLSIDGHDTIALPYEDRRRLAGDVLERGENWMVPAHRIGDGQGAAGGDRGPGAGRHHGQAPRLDVQAGRPDQGVAQGQAPPADGGRHRRVHARRRQPHRVVRGAARRALARPPGRHAVVRRRRRQRVHPSPARRAGVRFADLRTDECPFDPLPPTSYRRGATWLRPELSATVEITEFTNEGFVRQAAFIELAVA